MIAVQYTPDIIIIQVQLKCTANCMLHVLGYGIMGRIMSVPSHIGTSFVPGLASQAWITSGTDLDLDLFE